MKIDDIEQPSYTSLGTDTYDTILESTGTTHLCIGG